MLLAKSSFFKKETALELAVERDDVELVLLLLDNGASLSTVSCRMDSVLHKAVLSGPEMLRILLERAKGTFLTVHNALHSLYFFYVPGAIHGFVLSIL